MKKSLTRRWQASDVKAMKALLAWFEKNARALPWRTNQEFLKNPYAVWVSEVMSQQSTMAMMLPYFEKWMKRFPTLESLATAPLNEVEPFWAGLGYYSRVRNLHQAAIELLQLSGGISYPHNYEAWLILPGVGPYTAAAVTAICFDQKKIPIDGNVIRVFSRFLGIQDPLNSSADRAKLELTLAQWEQRLPPSKAGAFAQAVMDLGAGVCRPRELAHCEGCPLSFACVAHQKGLQSEIPQKKSRPAMRERVSFVPIYRDRDDSRALLLRQIPKGQRLSGHWALPEWELSKAEGFDILPQLSEKFEVFKPIRHTITCHRYQLFGVEAGVWPEKAAPVGHEFFELDALLGLKPMPRPLSISTATRKILHFLVDSAS